MRSVDFAKGHGTRNDFVLFVDRDGQLNLSDAEVAFVCDRRSGIGADGILRAVESTVMLGADGTAGQWFMDYRNADGSIAEMCGNGLRVFLRYLAEEKLVDPSSPITVGTRAGLRTGWFGDDGQVSVTMGAVALGEQVQVTLDSRTWSATSVDVGNPHAVVILDPCDDLDALDLTQQPTWEPASAFPSGVNVEFVEPVRPDEVRMRVHERGVGETQSCGTGVVAVAGVTGAGRTSTVRVPGGVLQVDLTGDDALLTGPAVVVARGRCDLPNLGQ